MLASVIPIAASASAMAEAKPPPSGGRGGGAPRVASALLPALVLLKRLRKLSWLTLLELRALIDMAFSVHVSG
jgi:hypothetical protein